MQASDYFEDFGENHEEEEDKEDENEKIKSKKSKGNKNKSQGKDKLMGELEHLALGDENEVRHTALFLVPADTQIMFKSLK